MATQSLASSTAMPSSASALSGGQYGVITLEDGWSLIKSEGIDRLFAHVDSESKASFSVKEASNLYSTIYQMCVQRPPYCYTSQLYDRFVETVETRLREHVLPAVLEHKSGSSLVGELVRKWEQHKVISSWLCRFFMYLDRYYTGKFGRPSLASVCSLRFESIVFNAVQPQVTAATLDAIRQLRMQYSATAAARADAKQASVATTSTAIPTLPLDLATSSTSTAVAPSQPVDAGVSSHPWLKSVIGLYLDLEPVKATVYRRAFESAFLRETTNFYTQKSALWLSGDNETTASALASTPTESIVPAISCSVYVARAEVVFELECSLQATLLHPCTEPFLVKALYDALLAKCYRNLFAQSEGGLKSIFQKPRERAATELAQLFRLFAFLPDALPLIASEFKDHLIEAGTALQTELLGGSSESSSEAAAASQSAPSSQAQLGDNYIAALLDFHEAQHQTLSTSFQSHVIFSKAFKQAFETLVAAKSTSSGAPINHVEMLAAYLDTVLKKPAATTSTTQTTAAGASSSTSASPLVRLSEAAMDAKLEAIARVFVYLADKDVFHEAAARYLSKRLLNQRSESIEAERLMITKLKLRCGAQYTNRLETMVNDMRSSALQQAAFENWQAREGVGMGGIDFGVTTLTLGSWPTVTLETINLPTQLSGCLAKFEQFYQSVTSNRQLKWVHSLGSTVLRCKLGDGTPFEAAMSTMQAATLLLLNDHVEHGLSIQAITDQLGVAPDVIKLVLRSLVSGQYPILVKEPAESYAPTHIIKPNTAFRTQHRKIRLPLPLLKSQTGSAERASSAAKIITNRRSAIEAAIVRVMKRRKVLAHAALISEVTSVLEPLFPVEVSEAKAEIESLIKRDYLERDRERPHVYHYVA